ncbi:MAG: LamG domain-containing protein [Pedobacter sp.]|nr:MAG: LamG domain-containing protein [Pedobacter sp.]
MKFSNLYKAACAAGLLLTAATFSSCEKDGNPNKLPEIDKSKYEGTVAGYASSDDVFKENLVAYFSFDENYSEKLSNTAPTQTSGNTLIDAGVRGKALNLNNGYLYYANQFAAFRTEALKSFTVSQWVKISNNGSKRTMLMQIARPGIFDGNLDIRLNTNGQPATNTDILRIGPRFSTVGGGSQDNLNANASPKIGPDRWVHIAMSYNGATGRFNLFANGINIGSYSDRGVGNNLFKSNEPSELIFGANYNLIPGKAVNTSVEYGAMTGVIDEVRIYNIFMPDSIIKALYELGLAKK